MQQGLGQVVNGTNLTVTEYAATQGIGAPGQNPSAILVNLSPVTLGPGVFQAGQGELNTVEVNDSRGTLSGWNVTGILESDFIGPNVGNDNTIPADYLTWNPSVSLTYPGNLQAGVVPNGTVSPPTYGPDACAAGSAATGTNSNITCPTVNDNAGANNNAGALNSGGLTSAGRSTATRRSHGRRPTPRAPAASSTRRPPARLPTLEPVTRVLPTSARSLPRFSVRQLPVAVAVRSTVTLRCRSQSRRTWPLVRYTATMDLLTTAT